MLTCRKCGGKFPGHPSISFDISNSHPVLYTTVSEQMIYPSVQDGIAPTYSFIAASGSLVSRAHV